MRRPRRRIRFHLRDLLVCITVVAVLIQPAHLLFDWIAENLLSPRARIVTVPDGGTVIIGGIRQLRDDGTMLLVTPRIIIQEETLVPPSTSGSCELEVSLD